MRLTLIIEGDSNISDISNMGPGGTSDLMNRCRTVIVLERTGEMKIVKGGSRSQKEHARKLINVLDSKF